MERYDICILGPHSDIAAQAAEKLRKSISSYKLPGNVILPDPSLSYSRILVDLEELPFSDKAAAVLDGCRYLLILCTPDTKDNKSIVDKYLYFKKQHNGNDTVAVIVEAEPVDCFLTQFIETRTVKHMNPDMTITEITETVEPIAADIRAPSGKAERQRLDYETVRIVASVLGIHPDVLEQRHARRRKQRLTAIAGICTVICMTIACVFLWFGLQAKRAGDIAVQQKAISDKVNERMVSELPDMFSDDPEALELVNDLIASTLAETEAKHE